MRNVPDENRTENQNTHFIFTIFFPENRVISMIMWKNTVQWGRPQMTIWRMRIACWITNVTYTLTLLNISWSSTATMVA
jgi:hypothetical protein